MASRTSILKTLWRTYSTQASKNVRPTNHVYDTFAKDQPEVKPVDDPKTASELFDMEKKARLAYTARLEKVTVTCEKPDESEVDLDMNKSISTPYACALHISEALAKQSAIAVVDGEPYDMHKPLDNSCRIGFLNYRNEDPTLANEAYWRTGSYILGYIVSQAFKETAKVSLKNSVVTPIDSGSFAYDFEAALGEWVPSSTDLISLSRFGGKLTRRKYDLIPLELTVNKAKEVLTGNRYENQSLNKLDDEEMVTLYRMGDYIDVAAGPLINNTSHIGRFTVSAIHRLDSGITRGLYRIQGVSLPSSLPIHYYTYKLVTEHAEKLNKS